MKENKIKGKGDKGRGKKRAASAYTKRRAGLIYYQVVRKLAKKLATDAETIIDIGSRDTPCLEWFGAEKKRTSLDLRLPLRAEGIESIKADFLQWTPPGRLDLALCLQVLEHVPDAAAFAKKLLATSKTVIVSVPYKWRQGQTPSHVHDPVDEAKLLAWFGREPHFSYLCREVHRPEERLICVYDDPSIPPWKGTREREEHFGSKAAKG